MPPFEQHRHYREPLAGRGTRSSPSGRFEALRIELDPEDCAAEAAQRGPETRYFADHSRSVLARNQSPDVGFEYGLNPYRGCEHGCVYCYARPYHEFLGFSAGLDFETRILVKRDAPALLRRALARRAWQPQVIALSGATDCYQPAERNLGITRRCLEVLCEFRNPVSVITKSRLVARDADLLADLARHRAASVTVSITTLEPDVARAMEPRAAQPGARLAAIRALSDAGVPVGVNVAPVVPGLTDHEIPAILRAAAEAGAGWGAWIMLKLPGAVADLFEQWLDDHFPERKRKVLSRVRELRAGRLHDPRLRTRQRGEGPLADHIGRLFELSRIRAGLAEGAPALSAAAFRRSRRGQLELF